MTAKSIILTPFLALAFALAPACGGTEDDAPQEPGTEQSDDALRPRPSPTISSCSVADVTCYDAKGRVIGTSNGCAILCSNGQTAQCWAGTCGTRVIIDAACGCFAF